MSCKHEPFTWWDDVYNDVAGCSGLLKRELGISRHDPNDPIPELDDEFGAANLQDDLSVFGDYSVQALVHETTMQLLVRLKTMGDLSLGKKHTNR